ncbi:MAG: GNAT family N-acetyltransferase [Nitrosopumilaceae archaeon]
MNLKTEISYEIENKIWDDALLLNKASTAYQIADFYQPYRLAFNSKPVFITVSNPSGKIVGQLSGVIHLTDYWLESNIISKSISSKFDLGSTLSWFHGPIIHDAENTDEILSSILLALDKVSIQNNVNLIKGSSPPQMSLPIDVFKKNGYDIKPWITYITNLQRNMDDVYNTLHNKTRYDIRKGEKKGLDFEVVSKKESYELYIDVKYDEEKKVQKLKKLYKEFLNHAWDISEQKGFEKMFLARFEGKPISAMINVLFNRNVVQVGIGNTSDRDLYGGSFLTWNAIRWSSENNYRTYDVGGANPIPVSQKEKGINLFKSKWASEKFDYFLCTKVFNRTKLNFSKIIKHPTVIKNKMNRIFSKKIVVSW